MGNIHWVGTLHLNTVRIASATVTFAFVILLGKMMGAIGGGAGAQTPFMAFMSVWFVVLVTSIPMVATGRALDAIGMPFAGLIAAIFALAMTILVALGDPLIWIGRKFYPALIPSVRFSPLNFQAFIMVEKE